jgi:hypothetical protein
MSAHKAVVSDLAKISISTGIPIQICSADELYCRIGCATLFGDYYSYGYVSDASDVSNVPLKQDDITDRFGLARQTFMLANHNPFLNYALCLAGIVLYSIKQKPIFPLLSALYVSHIALNRYLDQQNCLAAIKYTDTPDLIVTQDRLRYILSESPRFTNGYNLINFMASLCMYNSKGDSRWLLSSRMPTSRLIERIEQELTNRSSVD